jgi:hypothetical protein
MAGDARGIIRPLVQGGLALRRTVATGRFESAFS